MDVINKPPHYNQGGVECIEAIESALTREEFIGALKFQIIKYVWRAGRKGSALQDAGKAEYYLVKLIDKLAEDRND
jgi:hypothetical protein